MSYSNLKIQLNNKIADPTARLILIVRAFMDMSGETSNALTLKVWDCVGKNDISKRSRVSKNIDKNVKDYWVEKRLGLTSVIHHVQ